MSERRSTEIKMHERIAGVETDVRTILTNHLPHLEQDIKDFRKEANDNINGLGTRFEKNLLELGDRMDKRQEKTDQKFWAIIVMLITALIGIAVTLLTHPIPAK